MVDMPEDVVAGVGELRKGNEEAGAAIKSLKDGDVLVINVHSNPNGFMDGDKFIRWKDFWEHYRPGERPPRLSRVLICGCMVYDPKGIEMPIAPRGVVFLGRYLNADGVFVPQKYYGYEHNAEAEDIIRGLAENRSLQAWTSRKLDKFQFAADPSLLPGGGPAPGGVISVGQHKESRYCTNNPNVGVQSTPAPQVQKSAVVRPDASLCRITAYNLLDQMKKKGVDAGPFQAFQEALVASIRGVSTVEEARKIPQFLRPPYWDNLEAGDLPRWKQAAEASALAWWTGLLQKGLSLKHSGPQDIDSFLRNSIKYRMQEGKMKEWNPQLLIKAADALSGRLP
jgi:hypothetical protein